MSKPMLIRLAQPGDMFEKYAPDSPWMTDPDASRVRKAVIKRVKPKGAVTTSEGTFTEHIEHGEKKLIPIKASDQRNIGGYRSTRYRQMIETKGKESVKKTDLGTEKQSGREIANIRGSMAGELRGKHRVILGLKKQIGIDVSPMGADQMARVKDSRKPAGKIIPTHGHGLDRPMPMDENLPKLVSEAQSRLKIKADSVIAQKAKRHGQLEQAVRNKVAKGIERERESSAKVKLTPDVIRSKAHEAISPLIGAVAPSASEKESAYGHLANYTGKSVDRLERIRQKLESSGAWNTGGGGIDPGKAPGYRSKIEKKLIDTGAAFKPAGEVPRPSVAPRKSYPALRKLGIGAAALAGAAGVVGLIHSRKKEPQQLSAKTKDVISLARGDVYERAMREFITPATRAKIGVRTIAARGRTNPKMGMVQRKMGAEYQADFIDKARSAGNKNTLTQERSRAAVDLVKARAIKQTRSKVTGELADRDAQIATLTEHKENFKKRAERLQKGHPNVEAIRAEGYKEGRTDAERLFTDTTKTKQEDFNRRVAAESEYHSSRAQDTIRKVKASSRGKIIAAATGAGAGGVIVGRESKKEKVQLSEKQDRREIIRGAANMGISAGVTGAATGAALTLAGRRSSLGRSKIGVIPKLIIAAKSGAKLGAITGGAGLASSAVGTGILGAPKKREGAAYTKRGAVGGGILGAVGGGVAGALALKNPAIRRVVAKHTKSWAPLHALSKSGTGKRIAIGASVGAVAGAAQMADEGQQVDTINSTKRKPMIRFSSNDDKLHDVATGAIEGGVGVLATDRLIQKFAPHGSGIGRKLAIGAGVGAVATGAIGALLKKVRSQPDPNATQQFAVRTSVSQDRYRKHNEEADLNRRDANVARSVVAGGALGAVLKKAGGTTKTRALVGAGLGAASVLGIRSMTNKDQWNDRTHAAKVAESVPWKAAGLTAAVLAAGRGKSALYGIRSKFKLSAKGELIQLGYDKWNVGDDRFNARRRAEDITKWSRRGSGLIADAKGGALDERGRPRRREIDKPWVRNLITTGVVTAGLIAAKKVGRFADHMAEREVAQNGTSSIAGLREAVRNGAAAKAAENKVPGFKAARKAGSAIGKFAGQVRDEVKDLVRDPAQRATDAIYKAAGATGGKKPAPGFSKTTPSGEIRVTPQGSPAAESAETKRRNATRKTIDKIARGEGGQLSSILTRVIELAENVDDWDIRDPRGRSARVFAPGSQRRNRRGKYWHEKKDNRELIHKAELGGALVVGAVLARGKVRRMAQAAPKAETKVAEDELGSFIGRKRNEMQRLSSKLTALLC